MAIVTPFRVPPQWIIRFWRGFLERGVAEPDFDVKMRIAYQTAIEIYEVLDAWLANVIDNADQFQRRALAPLDGQLDKLLPKLNAIGSVLDSSRNPSVLWMAAAIPLLYGPRSIVFQLAQIRNALVASGLQPAGTITTSQGLLEHLPTWSQPIPTWIEDNFRRTISTIWEQAEQSAPGEPATARDISKRALDDAIDAAVARVKASVKVGIKVALPWVPVAIGLALLLRKGR